MDSIIIPPIYNYCAVFLTFACNFKCSYCINHFNRKVSGRKIISGKDWVRGLNRIISREDLPITLQGGEPSLHPDFFYIINNLKPELNIDLLTNLQFDADEFIKNIVPQRIRRESPYASIRVSYHPEKTNLDEVLKKALKMQKKNFSIGIWGVAHPAYEKMILQAQDKCRQEGIDFRLKEFLGEYNGRLYGEYKYPGACEKKFMRKVRCKTTELLIDCQGDVFRCHSDLYAGINQIGNILSADFQIEDKFRDCSIFGHCNPCDIKVKTNRFQQFGHTSVDIMPY